MVCDGTRLSLSLSLFFYLVGSNFKPFRKSFATSFSIGDVVKLKQWQFLIYPQYFYLKRLILTRWRLALSRFWSEVPTKTEPFDEGASNSSRKLTIVDNSWLSIPVALNGMENLSWVGYRYYLVGYGNSCSRNAESFICCFLRNRGPPRLLK